MEFNATVDYKAISSLIGAHIEWAIHWVIKKEEDWIGGGHIEMSLISGKYLMFKCK